jgi:stage V sporulation protein B
MARRSLKYNAAILTVTGFIVKAIGFVYRVFIANRIGSEGLGLYQLVTPIYSLLVLVLSAGVSVAVSRFVAEETSKRMDYKGIKIASVSAGIVMIAGLITCGVLLLNLDSLVLGATGDIRTRSSLFWTLVLVPPIAAASAYKGYFYGREEMMPNAVAQILEQVAKLTAVLILFDSFKGHGVENLCLLAVIAMLIGECVNVLVVYIAFRVKTKKQRTAVNDNEVRVDTVRKICKTAIPISVNRLILSSIWTVESLIIPQRLILYGLTLQESLKEFGRLSGMASPLVFFPSMLPGALSTALVPAIAGAVASRHYMVANRQISQSVRLTFIMGLVFTSFFACCSNEIAELVYPGNNVGPILYLLSFTGVFLYLQQTMLGILNGLAREKSILINTLAGSIVRLIVVWFGMPVLGVEAYIYAVIAGSCLSVFLNFREISKITGMSADVGEWILKPLSAALLGSFLALVFKQLPELLHMSIKFTMLSSTVIVFVIIAGTFLLTGIVKREDLKRWAGKNKITVFELL